MAGRTLPCPDPRGRAFALRGPGGRWTGPVRANGAREITKRDGQKPCLRIFRELSSALADPTGIATGVRGHSVEAELVALDVLHHEARLVDSIGKQ